MSVELPEAKIFAEQLNKELRDKIITSFDLQDYERLQRIGMVNREVRDFKQLLKGRIDKVVSRGNVVHVSLDNGSNLILGLEYGGRINYHSQKNIKALPRYHLKIGFDDGAWLTVRLTSMGIIKAVRDSELNSSYLYRRDFSKKAFSPLDKEFTLERFSQVLSENSRMLKSVLVGKYSVIVGLSNSAFQDIIYRARLHPKKKASDLTSIENLVLYEAIKFVLKERIRLNGKDQFYDIYGNQGRYKPAMGSNMKKMKCPLCNEPIEKMSLGGGTVYYCPVCQK